MALCLAGVTAYTPLERIADALLVIEEGVFSYMGPRGAYPLASGARVLDFRGSLACPGFVDLQVNGLGADAFLTADAAGVRRIARELARRGTAAFLPTFTTASQDELIRAARVVSEAWALQKDEGGVAEARILGVHLEGPYLEPEMRGAHPDEHVRAPSKDEVEAIARAAGGLGVGGAPGLAMVTLSPGVAGAAGFARWLAENGVVPAMGHTRASADCVEAFLEAGGAFAVHAFNRYGSQETPAYRSASPMDFVQDDERLSAGLIADGVHVAPRPLASFVRARGWERSVLTSDLVADGGLRPRAGRDEARDEMPGDAVFSAGVLSGSRLPLSGMLPRLRHWCGLDAACALATATRNPARVLGMESARGRLAQGLRADLCVLEPDSLELLAVMINGKWASGAPPIAGL
ncbi:MAG: amidohydrolase family protein [Nitrospinae bacterium]|nr:amidohydrolase family protein [Nitrospinota bacterium]